MHRSSKRRPLRLERLEERQLFYGLADIPAAEGEGPVMPAFSLADVNPASPRASQNVSPRDYLEQVSGWYFTHST